MSEIINKNGAKTEIKVVPCVSDWAVKQDNELITIMNLNHNAQLIAKILEADWKNERFDIELCQKLTREEFINEAKLNYMGILNVQKDCPSDYGLEIKHDTYPETDCETCWRNAVSKLKFKGDL